ncbi:OmpH family outer membrane protein [uncultured Aliivibrio sp.]|uniref:OmpH family outer membrane protein n=1 Tax=Aliivibrio salmonicida TaxID=40269 RepID=UPI002625BA2E|nr:OmpH family outer membrane protein [uncultured Aliivibrio sp.]
MILKKLVKVAALGAVLLSGSFFANAAEAATKIGYVNMAQIVQQMPQREAISEKLRAEFKDRIDELRSLESKIKDKVETIKRDGELLGASGKTKLEREIASLQSDYKLKAQALDEDNRRRQGEERQKLIMQVQQTVEKVANKEGYDMVVDAATLLWAKPEDNLSEKVIKAIK